MYKKILGLGLALIMIANFTACGKEVVADVDSPTKEVEIVEKVEKTYSEATKEALGKLTKIGKFTAESTPEVLDGKENNVYSPISFYLALAMLSELDHNDQEILEALQVKDIEEIEAYAKEILEREVFEDEETSLHLANSIWLSDEDEVIEEVSKSLKDNHSAEARMVNFKKSSKVISEMKEWISKNTKGLIDQASPVIDKETKMVILNAIYLKNLFLDEFFESQETTLFTDIDGEFHNINMLSDYSGYLNYYETESGQVVTKPLEKGMQAVFVRPKESLEKVINTESMAEILAKLEKADGEKKANIKVPPIDLTSKADLVKAAKRLGIQKAFDPSKSNLQAYKNLGNPLFVSLIQQEAAFKMDKYGIEAAAYTEIEMKDGAALIEEEPIEVVYDVPFIFMVLSKNSEPLFVGTYTKP